jgi:hypothetical protein
MALILISTLGCNSFSEAKRAKLNQELEKASTLEECETISEQIIHLPSPIDQTSSYQFYVAECLGHIAARNNNSELCLDQQIAERIVVKGEELMRESFPSVTHDPEMVLVFQDTCNNIYMKLIE